MIKKFLSGISFILAILLLAKMEANSQNITAADLKKLKQKEDTLKMLAKNLIVDSLTEDRMRSDSLFIRTLVRTLQVKNSFYYPLDSVIGIAKVYAPDSTFRIFTWALAFDDYYSRQRGAIQFRTKDGSLKLVPLKDFSEFTANPEDSIRNRNNWIGAVYYRIIQTEHNGKNFYTLFGYDNFSVRSNKKWIEVLTFNEKSEPIFGGKFFSFEEDSIKKPAQYRYSIEYKKDASTLVNFEDELQVILVDHLISESDEPEAKWTYVPDGDYEGFKWKNGKWVHINKVFDFKLEDGQFPVPDPIMDQKGKKNEEKLQEKSNKNKGKPDNVPLNYDN